MKAMKNKIVAGTVAASVLLGGGILGLNHVFAASTDAGSTATQPTDSTNKQADGGFHHGKRGQGREGLGFRGGNGIKEAATLLGVDPTVLKKEMEQGKTLAQVAQEKKGWSKDDFVTKLTDAVNQSIDAAVKAGTLTQAQADKQKSGLADRLKAEVDETHQFRGEKGFGAFGNYAQAAAIIGITEQELKTELQAGKSLSEIAQAKGISEDQLIGKLKDNMTDRLKSFVQRKGMTEQRGHRTESKVQPDTGASTVKPAPSAAANS